MAATEIYDKHKDIKPVRIRYVLIRTIATHAHISKQYGCRHILFHKLMLGADNVKPGIVMLADLPYPIDPYTYYTLCAS